MAKEQATITKQRVPAFDEILFTGMAVIIKKEGKRQLCIFNTAEEAVKAGVSKRAAGELFKGVFGPNNCITNFSIWGNVSCDGSDDCLPGKTCVLQMWDKPTKSWKDHSEGGSAPVGGATWRCKCK